MIEPWGPAMAAPVARLSCLQPLVHVSKRRHANIEYC
jgi:hypothetical protein